MNRKKLTKCIFITLLAVSCWPNCWSFGGKNYEPEKPTVRLKDLVGSKTKEVEELLELIQNPEKFENLGVDAPNAVLLYGEPGTGKTTLARAIASELDTYIIQASGSDLKSIFHGGISQNMDNLFEEARELVYYYGKPVIILLDELDGVLGGLNSDLNNSSAKEFLSKMKYEITNTEKNRGLYVFATTNHVDNFPKALTRSGRFMTIEVHLPGQKDRAIIFKKYLSQYAVERTLKTKKFYDKLAKKTAMFSGADIQETLNKAALKAAYNNQKKINANNIYDAIKSIHEKKHIELKKNKFAPEKSSVRLDELAGAQTEEIQLLLKQLKNPKQFTDLGASTPNAVLLYGPPGTGKTTLVRGIANHLNANFFALAGSDLEDKYVGGATKNLNLLFKNARKMAECSGQPSVILIDEMDGAIGATTRREMLAKLKYELTENNENVYIFATTNHPHYFPPALTRPGRFVKIEVPLPNEQDRAEIFKKYANIYKTAKNIKRKSFYADVAKKTEGFSCADIANIVEKAAQAAANKNQKEIKTENILSAIAIVKKTIDPQQAQTDNQTSAKKLDETISLLERIKKFLNLSKKPE